MWDPLIEKEKAYRSFCIQGCIFVVLVTGTFVDAGAFFMLILELAFLFIPLYVYLVLLTVMGWEHYYRSRASDWRLVTVGTVSAGFHALFIFSIFSDQWSVWFLTRGVALLSGVFSVGFSSAWFLRKDKKNN